MKYKGSSIDCRNVIYKITVKYIIKLCHMIHNPRISRQYLLVPALVAGCSVAMHLYSFTPVLVRAPETFFSLHPLDQQISTNVTTNLSPTHCVYTST